MKKASAAVLMAMVVTGCSKPTGNEVFDQWFVKNYRDLVEFRQLVSDVDQATFPVCDATTINSMAPDPYVRLGRYDRLSRQRREIERMSERMLQAGLLLQSKPSGGVLDCMPASSLGDEQMTKVMDERLDRQLGIIRKMQMVSAKILE